MDFFAHVMADLIHLVKIIVLCTMFFALPKREVKYRKWLTVIVGMCTIFTSSCIYFYNNYCIEVILYVLLVVGTICLLYREKMHRIVVTVIGIIFALSMIDEMTTILINILMELFNIDGNSISILLGSIVSLILLYFVGRLYRKNSSATLKSIAVTNLIGFTILLAVNTFVVVAISIIITESDILRNNNIYLLAVVFVIIGIFIQLASVILLFTQRNVYKEKEELADKYLNEQRNHYEYLENREKETKKFRHDLRSHMEMISNFAKSGEYNKIDKYLEQMQIKIDTFGNVVTVQNGIVDAIINQYYVKARQNGVTMEVKGRFPVDCVIEAYDLCTIFSNVLSNALEEACETKEKYISLECAFTDRNLIIVVTNSYNAELHAGGVTKTRKGNQDYHGYGLENIRDSVDKYKGVFDIETEDNIFKLKILFNNVGK